MDAKLQPTESRGPGRRRRRRRAPGARRAVPGGFTLLEVMLAALILGMISVSIYRFTSAALVASRVAAETLATRQNSAGLSRWLQASLDELPTQLGDALRGRVKGADSTSEGDELSLVQTPGVGLLSRQVPTGYYRATLALRNRQLGLAFETRRPDAQDQNRVNLPPAGAAGGKGISGWIPLMDGVSALQVNYFTARLNGWVPKWNDPNALPELVRVRLSFAAGGGEYETVLTVPPRRRRIDATQFQAQDEEDNLSGNPPPPGGSPSPRPSGSRK